MVNVLCHLDVDSLVGKPECVAQTVKKLYQLVTNLLYSVVFFFHIC